MDWWVSQWLAQVTVVSWRHQTITWTNAWILLFGLLETNFSEILIKTHTFSFKKMHLKILSAKWRQFCLALNTLRPRQNGRRFADDTFKRSFLNENVRISIKISLKFVPKGPINNNPVLVQIMAWRRSGDKPLSEPMMVTLLTHICVTRPQWVNKQNYKINLYNLLWHLHTFSILILTSH